MDHLKVDLDLLGQTATQLTALSDGFHATSGLHDEQEHAIGASALRSAVGSFETNWSQKRKGMLSSLKAVAQMATQSYQAYKDTDDKLASQLQQGSTAVRNAR